MRARNALSRVFLVLAWALLLNPVTGDAEEKPGALDGMVFVGAAGKMGSASGDREELLFRNGKLHSTSCDPYGFGDGVYFSHATGNLLTFRAETMSPTHGRITWRGSVDGDKLEGYFVWHKAPRWYRPWKSEAEYWVKLQLKK